MELAEEARLERDAAHSTTAALQQQLEATQVCHAGIAGSYAVCPSTGCGIVRHVCCKAAASCKAMLFSNGAQSTMVANVWFIVLVASVMFAVQTQSGCVAAIVCVPLSRPAWLMQPDNCWVVLLLMEAWVQQS